MNLVIKIKNDFILYLGALSSVLKYIFLFKYEIFHVVSSKESLEISCQKVLSLPKVRFVGVLNKMGNKIAGGFKEGVKSLLPDKENHMMYIQLMLEYMMRKDFDARLGTVDYIVSRRSNVTMISIPTKDYLVLISAERHVNDQEIIRQVNSAFTTLPDIVP